MKINRIKAALVYPNKQGNLENAVKSADIPLSGDLYESLMQNFANAHKNCTVDISFESEDQTHAVRDHISGLAANSSDKSQFNALATEIFQRLSRVTNNISGRGLLFLIVGKDQNGNHAVLISRYPATVGMLTQLEGNSLDVEVVSNVFIRTSHAYKAAYFSDSSTNRGFWNGMVVDKQINDAKREVSNYWVYDFLDATLSVTSARGTKKLAQGLKKAMEKACSIETKHTIAATYTLLEGMDSKVVSIESVCNQFSLPVEAVNTIHESLDTSGMFTSTFRLDREILINSLKYKSVYLDNGSILTAPSHEFENSFSRTIVDAAENKVKYETEGIESNIRVKSRL